MNIGEKAWEGLFPDREEKKLSVRYSNSFKPFNANVKYDSRKIEFAFSTTWKDVSEEIQIGLAQHLLQRIYKDKSKTMELDLYEKFMEKLPRYAQRAKVINHPELDYSYDRVNDQYFHGFMERPKIDWGRFSTTQVGTYSYSTDTVRISTVFQDLEAEDQWMLDYVMYHELLHKKFGVKHDNGSCRHHPPKFKKMEKKFHVKDAEKRLWSFVRQQKRNKTRAKGILRNIFK